MVGSVLEMCIFDDTVASRTVEYITEGCTNSVGVQAAKWMQSVFICTNLEVDCEAREL